VAWLAATGPLPILSGRRTDIYDTICKQERSRLS